jgi:hypothetical protein
MKEKSNKLVNIAITTFVVIGLVYFFLQSQVKNYGSSNIYSMSDLKYDDTTYKMVKENCDSGSWPADNINCQNMKKAR